MLKMQLLVYSLGYYKLTICRIKYLPLLFCTGLHLQTERNFLVKSITSFCFRLILSLLIEFARGGSRRRDEYHPLPTITDYPELPDSLDLNARKTD